MEDSGDVILLLFNYTLMERTLVMSVPGSS